MEDEDEKMAGRGKEKKGSWNWKGDFVSIIRNISGTKKLLSSKPSTAVIGNWGILQVAERISDWAGLGSTFQSRLFMGKRRAGKQKLEVSLSKSDSIEIIQTQWEALK